MQGKNIDYKSFHDLFVLEVLFKAKKKIDDQQWHLVQLSKFAEVLPNAIVHVTRSISPVNAYTELGSERWNRIFNLNA